MTAAVFVPSATAAHVRLLAPQFVRGFDREATAVERDTLSDQRSGRDVSGRFPWTVFQDDHLACLGASRRHRGEQSHAKVARLGRIDDRAAQPVASADAFCIGGERGGRQYVGRLVDEVSRVLHGPGCHVAGQERERGGRAGLLACEHFDVFDHRGLRVRAITIETIRTEPRAFHNGPHAFVFG